MPEITKILTPNDPGGPGVRITLEEADIKVVAIWVNGTYQVTIDDVSPFPNEQKRYENIWTPSQFAAVSFLFIDNETVDEPLTSALYTIAEEVCGKLPQNLRPIP